MCGLSCFEARTFSFALDDQTRNARHRIEQSAYVGCRHARPLQTLILFDASSLDTISRQDVALNKVLVISAKAAIRNDTEPMPIPYKMKIRLNCDRQQGVMRGGAKK